MYELMKLPFSYNALEPDISMKTVDIHYNKYYKKYVQNMNKLVNIYYPLELIPKNISVFPLEKRGDILYNAGGVLNHNLYWNSLNQSLVKPFGKLKVKIDEVYGSFDNFKKEFIKKAKSLVGSGYTFLVYKDDSLSIINLSNQDTPLSYDMVPLFTIDLWEHAYYLDYHNDRDKYIDNFFNKADFTYGSSIFENIA